MLTCAGRCVATTEEISQLKVNLCYEVMARSSREEKLSRLREELAKKGLEMLEKDSELQERGLYCWLLSRPFRRCVSVWRGGSYLEVRTKRI